ncbi:hypothetical protein GCM10027598_11650 [Amycolatopsis oliviviridis]|uniref:Uncharacterized protein n=1 Tax=Amycolatopsis oliviviridis TaxID=1471590 RepID=A0ABQ3LUS3_9PSEU|nr:hypothetical protein GCM10017790_54480 [Amycolatopsis oliviviridis]
MWGFYQLQLVSDSSGPAFRVRSTHEGKRKRGCPSPLLHVRPALRGRNLLVVRRGRRRGPGDRAALAARPEARVVPVFLAVPVALEGPADRRVLAAREDLVVREGPADLVVPVAREAPAAPRPVAPARSPVPRPLRRRGSPRPRGDGPAGSISVRCPWRTWSCSNSGSRSVSSCSRST